MLLVPRHWSRATFSGSESLVNNRKLSEIRETFREQASFSICDQALLRHHKMGPGELPLGHLVLCTLTFAKEEEAAVQEKEGDRNEEGEKEDDEKGNISERLWRLIGCPKEFPRLQSVALCFSHDCHNGTSWLKEVAQDNKFRAAVLNKFMSSLLSLPRPPRELAIRDLQNINTTDPATVAMITKVLGGLQSLRLNIMSEHDERNGEKDLNVWLATTPPPKNRSSCTHKNLLTYIYSMKNLIAFFPSCPHSG